MIFTGLKRTGRSGVLAPDDEKMDKSVTLDKIDVADANDKWFD